MFALWEVMTIAAQEVQEVESHCLTFRCACCGNSEKVHLC